MAGLFFIVEIQLTRRSKQTAVDTAAIVRFRVSYHEVILSERELGEYGIAMSR